MVIDISSETCDRYHHIVITDNGAGIARENITKIFKENQTLGKTDRFGKKGTGIGLFAIRNTLKSIGGNIGVESNVDKGSVFRISIPRNSEAVAGSA